jgi:3-oxoadipate enol-lactonase
MEKNRNGYNLTILVNNFHASYDDLGEGNVPVIFLHGFPFDKSMWADQLEFLKSSYRVIAVDIRGFGRSTDEESELSIELFADDLIGLMDALYIKKAVVCGLSMGGYVVLDAQKRYSDRFEALVLCDTQCIADTPAVKEKRLNTILDIEAEGVGEFCESVVQSVFHKDSLTNKKELVKNLGEMIRSNSPQVISQGLVALAQRSETCSSLSAVKVPTLIICGREDGLTPVSESEKMHKSIKGSTLKIIEDAGHVSNLEQPKEFNMHLGDFLSELNEIGMEELIEIQKEGN